VLQVAWAFIFQILIDSVLEQDLNNAMQSLGILVAMFICIALLYYCNNYFLYKYIQKTLEHLKDKLFTSYINQQYIDFFKKSEGDYLNTIVKLCSELREQYIIPMFRMVSMFSISLLAFAAVMYYHYIMGLVVIALAGLQLLIPILQKKAISVSTDNYVKESAKFSGKVQNILGGFELILSKNIQDKAMVIFSNSNSSYQKKYFKMRNIRNISGALVFLAQYLIILVPWFVGAILVINGEFTFGVLMAISQLNNSVSEPLTQAISHYNEYLGGKTVAQKIKEDVNEKYIKRVPLQLEQGFDSLVIKNLCFSYDDKPILKNIHLTFEKHKKYIIIGESGCGKSTLAKILGGVLTSHTGDFTANEQRINLTLHTMANVSVYSPQEAYLFNDTFRNNITLYDDIRDDEIDSVLEKLHLNSLTLPNGKDTLLGGGGQHLSVGQKQRIGIARTLLSHAPIVILDEPTASLDANLRDEVEELIISLKKTVISINHNLNESMLKRYDTIIFMVNGEVAGLGNFEELIRKNDDFAFFINSKGWL